MDQPHDTLVLSTRRNGSVPVVSLEGEFGMDGMDQFQRTTSCAASSPRIYARNWTDWPALHETAAPRRLTASCAWRKPSSPAGSTG